MTHSSAIEERSVLHSHADHEAPPSHVYGLKEYLASVPSGALPRAQHVERVKGAIGLGYRSPRSYCVGKEKIREYARAIFASHPVHYSEEYTERNGVRELIASPTFIGILGMVAQRPITEGFVTGYDASQIMQTEQRISYYHPIYAGDELWIDVSLDAFREIVGTDILVVKNEVYNQDDINVLSSWTTVVARIVDEVNEEVEKITKGVMLSERKIV